MTDELISITKAWISKFVIKHHLCPFAKFPFDRDEIYYSIVDQKSMPKCLEIIYKEIFKMHLEPNYSTGFLIFNHNELEFGDLLEIKDLALELLNKSELRDLYQLVAFHPKFRFSGLAKKSPQNRVNQSPYPMLHILSESDVTKATIEYGDIDQILVHNKEKLRRLYKDQ